MLRDFDREAKPVEGRPELAHHRDPTPGPESRILGPVDQLEQLGGREIRFHLQEVDQNRGKFPGGRLGHKHLHGLAARLVVHLATERHGEVSGSRFKFEVV